MLSKYITPCKQVRKTRISLGGENSGLGSGVRLGLCCWKHKGYEQVWKAWGGEWHGMIKMPKNRSPTRAKKMQIVVDKIKLYLVRNGEPFKMSDLKRQLMKQCF